MPFEIIRGDITETRADAIVNTANPMPIVGYGVDAGIHKKAGPNLLKARQKIGAIAVGDAAITRAYQLPARYVIHAVSPAWSGGNDGEEAKLRHTYDSALELAAKHRCKSIAFPLLATGHYGFPKPLALQIAISAFSAFLMEHEMQITLVVFDRTAFQISGNLVQAVKSYIDENYVRNKLNQEFGLPDGANDELRYRLMNERRRAEMENRYSRPDTVESLHSIAPRKPFLDGDMIYGAPAPMPEEEDEEERDGGPAAFRTARSDSTPRAPMPPAAAPCPPPQQAKKPVKRDFGSSSFTMTSANMAPSMAAGAHPDLNQLLKGREDGFSPMLLHLIDRSGRTDADVYKHANVDRRLFSKIRSNPRYNPSKPLVLAFAISLRLDLQETKMLLERAGFALSPSSITDIVVAYCINNHVYDIYEVNNLLFEFDGSLLGSVRETREEAPV